MSSPTIDPIETKDGEPAGPDCPGSTSPTGSVLSELEAHVFEVFVRETEYSRASLGRDLQLEGDLGIDSMTQLSIWEALGRDFGLAPAELRAAALKTIDAVVAYLHAHLNVPADAAQQSHATLDQPEVRDERTMQDFFEVRAPDLFEKARSFHVFYQKRRAEDLYWYGMALHGPARNRAVMYDEHAGEHREFLLMATNNYLGLANHPEVLDAIQDAARRYGATHTGCRLIGGTNTLHKELERELAAFKGTQACIIFPSGYSANLGTISALVRRHDVVISDKYNHMSIADGCKLASGSMRMYQHSDMDDLERVLRRTAPDCDGTLIVTDGVFSMHGDVCALADLVRIKKQYGARLLVDDAHATGVLGRTGAGTSEHFGLKGQVDLELGTFSKALAGVGGFVACSEEVADYLRFYANSYVFAATIPAPVAAGLIASLKVMRREPERIERLWQNITYFKRLLSGLGFNLERSASAIVPVVIGDYAKTLRMGRSVRARGLFCQTVVYPGVASGEERLRLSVTSEHTEEDLDLAAQILAESAREVRLNGHEA